VFSDEQIAAAFRLLRRYHDAFGPDPVCHGDFGPWNLVWRGGAARYAILLDSDPTEAAAFRHLRRIERDLPGLLRRYGLGDAHVGWGGETPLGIETVHATDVSLWRVVGAAFAINFLLLLLLLLLFLRSLLAPLYLLLASAAALAATFGLTIYVFTALLHDPRLPYYVPVAFSVLLLSLGSDYDIFVVGHVWKQADSLPLREAVTVAAPQAGRAIAVVGVALGLSFTLLAIIRPLRPGGSVAAAADGRTPSWVRECAP